MTQEATSAALKNEFMAAVPFILCAMRTSLRTNERWGPKAKRPDVYGLSEKEIGREISSDGVVKERGRSYRTIKFDLLSIRVYVVTVQ